MTLTEMCPGEAYEVFLSSTEDLDFYYPSDGLAKGTSDAVMKWNAYNEASPASHYQVAETGLFHPIIITDLEGVELGDELAAYANGELIGATKIVDSNLDGFIDMPIALSAWEGYHEHGVDLAGYAKGDQIELRLWSNSENKELEVSINLDVDTYGDAPLSVGTGSVDTADVVPVVYSLSQNYPNPFNPSTSIEFSLKDAGHATLNIYDISGRLVSTLIDGNMGNGSHKVVWDGMDNSGIQVSAGLYIYSLQTADMTMTKKMVFMK